MEPGSAYLLDESLPCFWVGYGYYKSAWRKERKGYYVHQYNGIWLDKITLSGVKLPLINCDDYRLKYETLCFTIKHGERGFDSYLSEFLEIYPAFEINPAIESKEAMIALQYTPQALEWLRVHLGYDSSKLPAKAPAGLEANPLIFFLFQNSD